MSNTAQPTHAYVWPDEPLRCNLKCARFDHRLLTGFFFARKSFTRP